MKRRHFLGAAGAGLAISTWPAWLRDAFGEGAACDPAKSPMAALATLAGAFKRARDASTPLLVLIIPADDGEKWTRGEAFGELINHGSDKDLAPFAAVEVACATMADLKKLVPTAGSGEPMMVLVSTTKVPVTAIQLDVKLPQHSNVDPFDSGHTWEDMERRENESSDKRIATLGKLLRDAIGVDERRAPALAAEVKKRIKDKPPSGAKWANSSGCGTLIEGETDTVAYACGMGHTPPKARRFLYFFTKQRGL